MVLQRFLQNLHASLPQNAALSLPVCKDIPLEIEFENDCDSETVLVGSEPPLPFANSGVFNANILSWRRLTALDEACKDVYEVTFDIKGSGFTFKAGDTIGIVPENDQSDIFIVLNHLGLKAQADCRYKLSLNTSQKGCKIPPHIPHKSTLRHVLTHCVDLRCVLKKLFLLALSKHTKDETERRILEFFCSKEGATAYQTHILDRNLTLADLFAYFPSCKPSIQVLLAHLPRLLPRPYSIVNSGIKEAGVLKICFSVVQSENYKTGLVTGWLERKILNKEYNLEIGLSNLTITHDCDTKVPSNVPVYLRKNLSGFCLPESIETPLILIGRGTGVAPFLGFLQEREMLNEKQQKGKAGDVWLFFGCRNPDLDFIYEKELNEFVEKGILKKLCTAFSRVENSKSKYIQDALMQNSEEIAQLVESNASIMICGDLKGIAAQMKDTLTQCLVSSGKTLNEAKEIISNMQKEKRYVVDAWS